MVVKTVTALTRDMPVEHLWAGAPSRVVVNSVKTLLRGEAAFTTLVEAWWPSRSAIKLTGGAGHVLFSAVVDEVVFATIDRPKNRPVDYCKTFTAYHLPPGIDGDAFWHYHADIHGPDVVNAAGNSLFDYSLNKRIETLDGQPTFFALIEMWWASNADRENYPTRCASYITASGKSPLEDFMSRGTISEFSVIVDERPDSTKA